MRLSLQSRCHRRGGICKDWSICVEELIPRACLLIKVIVHSVNIIYVDDTYLISRNQTLFFLELDCLIVLCNTSFRRDSAPIASLIPSQLFCVV